MNKEDFLSRAFKVHGKRYDYSKSIYVNTSTKMIIICPEHGEFLKNPRNHIYGKQGCPKCTKQSKLMSKEDFIKESKKVHGDKYSYEKTIYINCRKEVIISCPIHGDFLKTPRNHLYSRQGCPKCKEKGKIIKRQDNKRDTIIFITNAVKIHGKKYDYTKVVYKNCSTDIIITCPIHGDFKQKPNTHLQGCGCPECKRDSIRDKLKKNVNTFIKESNSIHSDKYSYSKTNYKNWKENVIITCPIHGDFEQKPDNHIRGMGCPKCGNVLSKIELSIIDLIKRESNDSIKIIHRDRKTIHPRELDLFFPDYKFAIEFNGNFWHSSKFTDNLDHIRKTISCEKLGINLLHIFEDEWTFKRSIIESKILYMLGCAGPWKVYARECTIEEIGIEEKSEFLEKYHIQGNCRTSISYGLRNGKDLVSVMTFKKCIYRGDSHPGAEWELDRFATGPGIVVGGASRLLKAFERKYNPQSIVSYADRRWSNGGLYNTLDFKLVDTTKPDYYYVHPDSKYLLRENKRKYQLRDLPNLLESFNPKLTESENMRRHGFLRLWDCGKLKYIKEY
jgi:hypothetical protein